MTLVVVRTKKAHEGPPTDRPTDRIVVVIAALLVRSLTTSHARGTTAEARPRSARDKAIKKGAALLAE